MSMQTASSKPLISSGPIVKQEQNAWVVAYLNLKKAIEDAQVLYNNSDSARIDHEEAILILNRLCEGHQAIACYIENPSKFKIDQKINYIEINKASVGSFVFTDSGIFVKEATLDNAKSLVVKARFLEKTLLSTLSK